jgi:protein-S-isoprenylcysteine O-methyltransferase Ste14
MMRDAAEGRRRHPRASHLGCLVVLLAYLTLDGPVLPSTWMRDEERELAGRHGPTYAEYHERTGRWLPRIRRR